MSIVAQIMQPGGGVLLLPLVRVVIGFLLLVVVSAFVAGVARVHMAVLALLSGGLLVSLSFFESEYRKAQTRLNYETTTGAKPQSAGSVPAADANKVAKTD